MGKPLTYKDRIQQSQEDKNQQASSHQVKQAELQLQSDILETELSVANAEIAVEEAKGANPFNSQALINAESTLEGYQNGLKKLQQYKAELFPTTK